MKSFQAYLDSITHDEHRRQFAEVLDWVTTQFPDLENRIGWNQPLFTHHGTFIIGFNYAKKHLSVTPEGYGIRHFADLFEEKDLEYSAMTVRFPWNRSIDFDVLKEIIEFNILDKKNTETFWRQ